MKHSAFQLIAFFLLFGFSTGAYTQCCPVKEYVGQRDQFLYEADSIVLDAYIDTNGDWLKWIEENVAPQQWDCNKFIRLRAWSKRSSNTDNYIQLYWWAGDGKNSALLQQYANGIGPKAGVYTLTNPMMGRFGYTNNFEYFWTHTVIPVDMPYLLSYRTHKYSLEDAGIVWVCPFSSYASQAGDMSVNNTQYVTGEEATSYITHFNSFAVTVDTGDDGNLYVQIGGQECNQDAAVTIGRKTNEKVHRLTVSTNGTGKVGLIPACDYYEEGDVITLVPTANLPIYFKEWMGEHADYITDNGDGTFSVTMQAFDMRITAVFDLLEELQGDFAIENVCGDADYLNLSFTRMQGKAVHYDLFFSDAAKSQGFADVINQPIKDADVIEWSLPMPKSSADAQWYVRPDDYEVTLNMIDPEGLTTTYSTTFTVLYPSRVILQRWNDVLTITNRDFNGGYEITHVEWYKDNEPIKGHGVHNFFYYAGDNQKLQTESSYRAEITRADDGKTISTCDYLPVVLNEEVVFKEEINIAPRRADSRREVVVNTSLSGRYQVFNIGGQEVMNGYFGSEYGSPDIIVPASLPNGTYLIRFVPNDAKQIHKKWPVY